MKNGQAGGQPAVTQSSVDVAARTDLVFNLLPSSSGRPAPSAISDAGHMDKMTPGPPAGRRQLAIIRADDGQFVRVALGQPDRSLSKRALERARAQVMVAAEWTSRQCTRQALAARGRRNNATLICCSITALCIGRGDCRGSWQLPAGCRPQRSPDPLPLTCRSDGPSCQSSADARHFRPPPSANGRADRPCLSSVLDFALDTRSRRIEWAGSQGVTQAGDLAAGRGAQRGARDRAGRPGDANWRLASVESRLLEGRRLARTGRATSRAPEREDALANGHLANCVRRQPSRYAFFARARARALPPAAEMPAALPVGLPLEG